MFEKLRFSWNDDSKPVTPSVDEHAANPGADAQATQPNTGAVSAHTIAAARAGVDSAIERSPRRRGRPPKDASASGGDSRALQAQIDAEIAKQLDALHDPKAWAALCCMPADTTLALTGKDHWKVSNDERATVGATGSALARTLMITNPRALAIMMFSSAMLSMYLPRLIKELHDLRQQRAEKERESERKNSVA